MQGRRAAIYARYSSELQDERSIDDQIALCRDHAARCGLTVIATFADRAKTSASIFGRDGLARLMEQARARAFDVILSRRWTGSAEIRRIWPISTSA